PNHPTGTSCSVITRTTTASTSLLGSLATGSSSPPLSVRFSRISLLVAIPTMLSISTESTDFSRRNRRTSHAFSCTTVTVAKSDLRDGTHANRQQRLRDSHPYRVMQACLPVLRAVNTGTPD